MKKYFAWICVFVLSSGDAAEYWLQRAYETFCNMAREIWMKEGDGNNGK